MSQCFVQHHHSSVRRSIVQFPEERGRMGGRLIYSSSGTEHEDETDSACLGDMVARFMEDSGAMEESGAEDLSPLTETMDANITEDCQTIIQSQQQFEILKGIISCSCPTELNLLAETVKCLEIARKLQQQPECLKKSVMCHLRSVGYDAAICKSRPKDNSRSFPSGNYDYLDVILKTTNSGRSVRLFVDLDFRAQFEIARPTREYSALLELLPKIYVGRGDRLQSIVKIMCEGVKNSLKRKGMHLPPWRKYKYMHSMWFAPYNRTIPSVLNGHEETKNREKRHEYKTAIKSKEKQRSRSQLPCDSVFDGKMVERKSGSGDNNSAVRRNETVEWKLPVVANPAMEKRQPKVSGLASALKETLSSGFCLAAF